MSMRIFKALTRLPRLLRMGCKQVWFLVSSWDPDDLDNEFCYGHENIYGIELRRIEIQPQYVANTIRGSEALDFFAAETLNAVISAPSCFRHSA